MSCSLHHHALLMTLFYQNVDATLEAFRRSRTLKNHYTHAMIANGLRKMDIKFEETGSLIIRPGRERNHFSTEVMRDDALMVKDYTS